MRLRLAPDVAWCDSHYRRMRQSLCCILHRAQRRGEESHSGGADKGRKMHAFRSTSALSFRTSAAAHLPTRSRTPRTTIVARRLRVQVRDNVQSGARGRAGTRTRGRRRRSIRI